MYGRCAHLNVHFSYQLVKANVNICYCYTTIYEKWYENCLCNYCSIGKSVLISVMMMRTDIKLKSHLSVCLSTFHLGHSTNLETTPRIKGVLVPLKALIIYFCLEYQEILLTAVICHLQQQEYEEVDKS